MSVWDDFDEIISYSHFFNWAPDWRVVKDVYAEFPEAFSVLTPFAYTYIEEVIRSTTSQYARELVDLNGKEVRYKTGWGLIKLAKQENAGNDEYLCMLDYIGRKYFACSSHLDCGDNRNSTQHGYMHSRYWTRDSFEALIADIACISPFAGF